MTMTYLSPPEWAPTPNEDDAPFWESCNARELRFQCCAQCRLVVHPPLSVCPGCQSMERNWIDAPAQARVFAFTWIHQAADESVAGRTPYNVVLVEFDGLPDVRLISNVIDAGIGELNTGDPLALVWESTAQGQLLPRFRRA